MKLRKSELQQWPKIDTATLQTLEGGRLLLRVEKAGETFTVCNEQGVVQVFMNIADAKALLANTHCQQWQWYSDDFDAEMIGAKH